MHREPQTDSTSRKESHVSRRGFLGTSVVSHAASTVFPLFTIEGTKASGQVIGANDTIRVGVAGINGDRRISTSWLVAERVEDHSPD